jgi:hypothetical protein
MSTHPAHPFPYFGLLVTRDARAIKEAVEKKYKIAVRWEYHITRNQEYKDFLAYADLVARHLPARGAGIYEADAAKVEKIIQTLLPALRPNLLAMVHPHGNVIHPHQIERVLETARDVFAISREVAEPYINRLIAENKISISSAPPPAAPPPPPARPVENVQPECLDAQVRLRWDLPPDQCDRVIVCRSDNGAPRPTDSPTDVGRGSEWLDARVETGKEYHYGVFSVVGNGSPSQGRFVSVCARGSIKGFQAVARGDRAVLSWQLPPSTEKVIVLRARTAIASVIDKKGGLGYPAGVQPVAELGPETQYEDTDVSPGEVYHYVVVARHPRGAHSPSECRPVSFSRAPPPPAGLKPRVVPGRIYLSWEPVPKAQYQLTRSQTPGENDPGASARQVSLKNSTYEDRDPEPGCSYWYAIHAVVDGVRSLQPARCGPVLATGEVDDLEAVPGDGKVTLTWTAPPRVRRVEVRRAEDDVPPPPGTPAAARTPGKLLAPGQTGGLTDVGLTNGKTYGYRVCCVFVGRDGQETVTIGQAKTAQPCAAPSLLTDVRAEVRQGLTLSWTNSRKATVVVVRSKNAPSFPPGHPLAASELDALGLKLAQVGMGGATDPAPRPDQPFYLVFATNGLQAIFCGQAQYVELEQVTARVEGEHVVLHWRWPAGCRAVRICHGRKHTGGPFKEVPRDKNATDGQFRLSLARLSRGEHAFHVRCVIAEEEEHAVAGPGQVAVVQVAKPCEVSWELEKGSGGFLRRGGETYLVVHVSGDLAGVEWLRLVGRINKPPEDADDGRCLAEWRPQPGKPVKGSLRLKVKPYPNARGEVYCCLFAEPPDSVSIEQPGVPDCVL